MRKLRLNHGSKIDLLGYSNLMSTWAVSLLGHVAHINNCLDTLQNM